MGQIQVIMLCNECAISYFICDIYVVTVFKL